MDICYAIICWSLAHSVRHVAKHILESYIIMIFLRYLQNHIRYPYTVSVYIIKIVFLSSIAVTFESRLE